MTALLVHNQSPSDLHPLVRSVFAATRMNAGVLVLPQDAVAALQEQLAGYVGGRQLVDACVALALLVAYLRKHEHQQLAVAVFSVIASAEAGLRQHNVALGQIVTAHRIERVARQYQKACKNGSLPAGGADRALAPGGAVAGIGLRKKTQSEKPGRIR